ncbi:MAG: hypothetical protein RL557_74 [archaeon]
MVRWFEEKFEKDGMRKHTLKRIDGSSRVEKIKDAYRFFSVTNWLIIVNIFVYLLLQVFLLSGISQEHLFYYVGLSASTFFSGAYWTLLTSMFAHQWLPHLFFNMISLFFVGNFLERIIGRKKFFWFYLASGIFAGLFYVTLSFYFGASPLGAKIVIDPSQYAVGASGAIFGIAGLLAILTPFMQVYLIAGPIIAIILQAVITSAFPDISALSLVNLIVTIYIFVSIFAMFSFNETIRKIAIPMAMPFWLLPIVAIVPLMIAGLFVDLPIGNTAHLGGLIAGVVYGLYLQKKYKKKTEMLRKMFR